MSNINFKYYIGNGIEDELEQLDLFKDESVRLKAKLIDAQDITALFNDIVDTFSIPATKKNSRIIRNWFEIGVDGGFNPNKRVDSYLELNSLPLRFGVTQLEEVIEKGNKLDSYKITFYGELTGLDDIFGEDLISELDKDLPDDINPYLEQFNFNYGITGVRNSFENPIALSNTNKADVVTPFIVINRDKELKYGGSNGGIDITKNPGKLTINNFRPAIRQKRILEAIENKYQINFSRDFFDRSEFNNLYLWLNGKEDIKNSYSWKDLVIPTSINFENIAINDAGSNRDEPDIKIVDNTIVVTRTASALSNFIGSNSSELHEYFFRLGLSVSATNMTFDVRVLDENDTIVDEQFNIVPISSQINFEFISRLPINLTSDLNLKKTYRVQVRSTFNEPTLEKLEIRTEWRNPSNEIIPNPISLIITNFEDTTDYLVNFNIINSLPEMSVADWLKAHIKQFKLIIRPQNDKTFLVDTINDYYLGGEELDITLFVDEDEVNTRVFKNKKKIKYTFNQTEDIITQKRFKEQNGRFIGNDTKIFNIDNKDKESIEIEFESPFFVRLTDSNNNDTKTFINLSLYQSINNSNEISGESTENPVQFYYNGLTNINEDINTSDRVIINFLDIANIQIKTVPICDSSNSHLFNQVTNNLDFSERTINGWHEISIENNIYNVFHKPWINNLINKDNRLIDLKAKLPLELINKLELDSNIIYKNMKYNIEEYEIDLLTRDVDMTLLPDFNNKFLDTGTEFNSENFSFTSGGGFGSLIITTDKELTDVNTNATWVELFDTIQNNRVYTIPFFVEQNTNTFNKITSINFKLDGVSNTIIVNITKAL